MAFINGLGFDALRERGVRTADDLPAELVYAGFSFGETIAQQLAQTRGGARGALLFYSCIPISGDWAFGPWPDGVPVQIHGADRDPFFAREGDIDAAREIVDAVDDAELFLYPSDQHYFADRSLPSYDPEASALLISGASSNSSTASDQDWLMREARTADATWEQPRRARENSMELMNSSAMGATPRDRSGFRPRSEP
jgi:hypothetical protein